MIRLRAVASLLIPFLIHVPAFSQVAGERQQAIPFGRRGLNPNDESGMLQTRLRVYAKLTDRGANNAAAQEAFQIASIYERQANYVDAATWYRTSYAKGVVEGLKSFIDLILLGKITIDNPETVRPFVEARAVCGSHIAREYVLANYHETPV